VQFTGPGPRGKGENGWGQAGEKTPFGSLRNQDLAGPRQTAVKNQRGKLQIGGGPKKKKNHLGGKKAKVKGAEKKKQFAGKEKKTWCPKASNRIGAGKKDNANGEK